MKTKNITIVLLFVVTLLTACGGNAAEPTVKPQEPVATEAVVEAQATEAPIVHTTIPSAPGVNLSNAYDNEETTSFENKDVKLGDDYAKNRFERPFTAETMDYISDIDIVKFSMGEDDNFFYVSMTLGGLASGQQTPTGHYGVEVDTNIDGRGEFIIVVQPSYTEDWSTEGVQIYLDENGDIGGDSAQKADSNYNGNGYERLVFDSGRGADPDLGWVKFTNASEPTMEIAFKKEIFPSTPMFMWSVWSSASAFDPAIFNIHDNFAEDRAGSPDKQSAFYPVNEIAAIDNSCRVPVGFTANGSEPLGCPVAGVQSQSGDNAPPPPGGGCNKLPWLCNAPGDLASPPIPPYIPVP